MGTSKRHLPESIALAYDVRDSIIDYFNYWMERSGIACKQLLAWSGLQTSKFHNWKKRYGKINEHNGQIPRDWWLEEWEKQAILDFHERNPLEGYRRLTFMMLDDDIVAVSPSSVYRVLKAAGRLDRKFITPGKKGMGYIQPGKSIRHGTLTSVI